MRTARYLLPAFIPALFLVMGCAGAAIAQDIEDPPDRVGRLSFFRGPVSFRPAGVDDWADATLNYPLTTGDDVWADARSRAEIALGSAAVRLAPYTAFGFLALDDQLTQIRLTQGSLQVRIRDLGDDETFEIDTPNGAVWLLLPGSYRVDVDANGDATTVTVRDGEAELTAAGSSFSVGAGEAATVTGIDSPDYDIHDAFPADEWERWGTTRDRRRDLSISARYVSRDMPGYEDLDDVGVWSQTAEYGAVWRPRVIAGWAPYRNGHWAWVDPWGWTWIDDAPWGFAPSHYGRWVYIGRGWAWAPGRVVARPVYAPALVAFVGGSNFSISVGVGGGVGWFPLGPNEPYVPTYRVSDRYVRNINITTVNVTNITIGNMTTFKYRNRGSPGGVTVVTRETFVGARPVGRSLIVVPRDRLNSAPIVGTSAPFAPTRESVSRQGGRPAPRPPANDMTRRVVVRTTPPPPPVPFNVRERAMQGRPGRPLDPAAVNALRGRTPVTENRVRPATGGGGRALRPARQGLPEARPVTPASGGRRAGQGDRPNQPRGEAGERPGSPRGRPQPEPRPPEPPAVPLPTPPLLPAENPQPAQPPRQDRGRRPDQGRPQAEPRPPAPQPTPEPPPTPEPRGQPPRQDRGRRPDEGRPQPEQRPPAAQPTPEPPRTPEPRGQPPKQDRGQRGEQPGEHPDEGGGRRGGDRPQAEPRPPAAEPTPPPPEPTKAAEPSPPPRERPSQPKRGDQETADSNQRRGGNPR